MRRLPVLLTAAVLAAAGITGLVVRSGSADATPAPSDVGAGTVTAVAGVTPPPANARWSYQLGGAYAPPAGVTVVDRDRSDAPAKGFYDVCYVNAFQAQADEVAGWRKDHDDLLLHDANGKEVVDTGWHETLFDISTPAKRKALAAIEGGWIDGCAKAGFQAVEPDNLDSYSRSKKLLTADDALAFSALLIARAHHDHLAIAQKNDSELAARNPGWDFAVAEQCHQYDECAAYTDVYGGHVLEVEYTDKPFAKACAAGDPRVERRDVNLATPGKKAYVEKYC